MLTMCDQVFDEKRDLFLLVHNKMFSPVIAAGTPKPKTRSKLHRPFSTVPLLHNLNGFIYRPLWISRRMRWSRLKAIPKKFIPPWRNSWPIWNYHDTIQHYWKLELQTTTFHNFFASRRLTFENFLILLECCLSTLLPSVPRFDCFAKTKHLHIPHLEKKRTIVLVLRRKYVVVIAVPCLILFLLLIWFNSIRKSIST